MNTKIKISVSPVKISSKNEGKHITDFQEVVLDMSNRAEVGRVIKHHCHSFMSWKNGHCTNDNYVGMCGVGVDIDSGLHIDMMRARLDGLNYILYTSTNHDPREIHKYRVLLPFDPDSCSRPRFGRKTEGEAVLNFVKNMFPESDQSTYKLAGKWFPTFCPDAWYKLYINTEGKWFNVTEADLLASSKDTSKIVVRTTTSTWKRPTPLTDEDVFISPDKEITSTLNQIRGQLSAKKKIKKLPVYCPRCDDLDSDNASGVVTLTDIGTVSLYCSHCNSEGDGIGGKGVYMEAPTPLEKNVFLYKNLDAATKPYWIDKDEDGFWRVGPTDTRKVLEAGYLPATLPFFENFILDMTKPDGELEVLPRGAVQFNAAIRSKYRPKTKPKRTISPTLALARFKKECPNVYAVFHNLIGDDKVETWMMNWFGRLLDHKQITCVPILAGNGGIGKSYFFEDIVGRILGKPYIYTSKGEEIANRFTSNRAETCWLFVANEVRITHQTEDTVKGLITNPSLEIEKKGVDAYTIPNRRSYVFTTNRGDAVKLASTERRYVVCYPPDGGMNIFDLIKSLKHTPESFEVVEERELPKLALLFESIKYDDRELIYPTIVTKAKKNMGSATENAVNRLYTMLDGRDEESVNIMIDDLFNSRNYKDLRSRVNDIYMVISDEEESNASGEEEILEFVVNWFITNKRAIPTFLAEGIEKVLGVKLHVIRAQAKDDLRLCEAFNFSTNITIGTHSEHKTFRCIRLA